MEVICVPQQEAGGQWAWLSVFLTIACPKIAKFLIGFQKAFKKYDHAMACYKSIDLL